MKNPGGNREARHHQGGLGPDMGFALQLRVYQGLGGDIPGADILFQGQVDEAVKVGGEKYLFHILAALKSPLRKGGFMIFQAA